MSNVSKNNSNDEVSDIVKMLANSDDASKDVQLAVSEYNGLSTSEKDVVGESAVGVSVRLKHAAVELVGALGYTQKQLEIATHEKEQLQQENELNKKIINQIETNKKYDKEKVESMKRDYISTQLSSGKVIAGDFLLACNAFRNYKSSTGNPITSDKLYAKVKK
jgi:hypothetical protein